MLLRSENNHTGFTGVSCNPGCVKPFTVAAARRYQHYLGSFATAEEAALTVARSGRRASQRARRPSRRPPEPAMTAAEAHAAAEAEGLFVRAENPVGFKHVSRSSSAIKLFMAQPCHGGRQHYLGCFSTAEEAALAVARFLRPARPRRRQAVAARRQRRRPSEPPSKRGKQPADDEEGYVVKAEAVSDDEDGPPPPTLAPPVLCYCERPRRCSTGGGAQLVEGDFASSAARTSESSKTKIVLHTSLHRRHHSTSIAPAPGAGDAPAAITGVSRRRRRAAVRAGRVWRHATHSRWKTCLQSRTIASSSAPTASVHTVHTEPKATREDSFHRRRISSTTSAQKKAAGRPSVGRRSAESSANVFTHGSSRRRRSRIVVYRADSSSGSSGGAASPPPSASASAAAATGKAAPSGT